MSTTHEKPLAFALRVFAEPGSAIECGKCRLCVGRVCTGFDKTLDTKPTVGAGSWHLRPAFVASIALRLPECIAAEKGTRE